MIQEALSLALVPTSFASSLRWRNSYSVISLDVFDFAFTISCLKYLFFLPCPSGKCLVIFFYYHLLIFSLIQKVYTGYYTVSTIFHCWWYGSKEEIQKSLLLWSLYFSMRNSTQINKYIEYQVMVSIMGKNKAAKEDKNHYRFQGGEDWQFTIKRFWKVMMRM